MKPELRNHLDTISQFAEDRQRELAGILHTIVDMDGDEFERMWEIEQKLNEAPVFEPGREYWERIPEEDIATLVPRDPKDPGASLTNELSEAIKRIGGAPSRRQEYAALLLRSIIENESWDVQLTEKQKRELEEARAQLPHTPAENS